MVSWYRSPPIASDVVNSTSICAHVEVAAVSRMKLHTEHVDRGAERCKGSVQKKKNNKHKIVCFTGGSLSFVRPGSHTYWCGMVTMLGKIHHALCKLLGHLLSLQLILLTTLVHDGVSTCILQYCGQLQSTLVTWSGTAVHSIYNNCTWNCSLNVNAPLILSFISTQWHTNLMGDVYIMYGYLSGPLLVGWEVMSMDVLFTSFTLPPGTSPRSASEP